MVSHCLKDFLVPSTLSDLLANGLLTFEGKQTNVDYLHKVKKKSSILCKVGVSDAMVRENKEGGT